MIRQVLTEFAHSISWLALHVRNQSISSLKEMTIFGFPCFVSLRCEHWEGWRFPVSKKRLNPYRSIGEWLVIAQNQPPYSAEIVFCMGQGNSCKKNYPPGNDHISPLKVAKKINFFPLP